MPGHLLFDTIAGALLAHGFLAGGLKRWFLPAFTLATLLHGTWNLLAGSGRWLPFLLYAGLLVAGTVAAVVWALRRSPHRRRQRDLERQLAGAPGLHPRLPRRVIRTMRRMGGDRQEELDRRLRGLLTLAGVRAEAEIEAVIAEESRLRGRAVQFWELVMGILLAGIVAHLVIALAGRALVWAGCGRAI